MDNNIYVGGIFHFGFDHATEEGENYLHPHFYLLTAIAFDEQYGWYYYFMPITSRLNNFITQMRIINRPTVLNSTRYRNSYVSFNRVFAVPFHLLGNCQPMNDFLNEVDLINAIDN